MTRKIKRGQKDERRRFPRVNTSLSVNLQVEDGERVACRVLDASISGVKVTGERALPIGADVTLIMPGSVHFGGRIVRRQGDTMGIEFALAPERVAAMIADLLPNLQAAR